jgi:hypothetical protein
VRAASEKRIETVAPDASCAWWQREAESDFSGLRITVVATNRKGTLAALRMAGRLAANLGARLALLKTQIVPFQFPLEDPPVAVEFLERQLRDLACEADTEAHEIVIQLWLCRERNETLRRVIPPRSLVVIGKTRRWLPIAEKRLGRYLSLLGHQVIFADPEERKQRKGPNSGFDLTRKIALEAIDDGRGAPE